MNHSSLFSFEESSVWDPKVIRKYLVVPQHQLTKLNEIPGWAKVQDNQNTLRLDKDFSIESSQSECSINVTQSNQRTESNIELFNDQVEDRKKILKCNKVYEEKLTRSLSLFAFHENCESILKPLKRTFSLPNLNLPPVASGVNNHFKDVMCENVSERHLIPDFCNKSVILNKPLNNFTISNQYILNSEPKKSEELLLSKEINLRTMETISELPINITVENAYLHYETVKENNGISPDKNTIPGSKNMFETKRVSESINTANINLNSETKEIEGMPANNTNLHSDAIKDSDTVMHVHLPTETTKESNGVLPAKIVALCSNNISDEHAEMVNKFVNVDNDKFAKSVIPASSVGNSDASSVKEVPQANIVPISENVTLPLIVQGQKLVISSNLSSENNGNISVVEKESSPCCSTNAMNKDDKLSSLEGTKPTVILQECNVSDLNNVENIVSENVAIVSAKNNDVKLYELHPSKSTALDIPAGELSVSKKESVLKTENLASSTEVNYKKNDQKKCDLGVSNNEGSVSKKRKLESRSKRSKRLKSDEKQSSNLKIRSIKKVREICYSAEEVKTMLDIMKQF